MIRFLLILTASYGTVHAEDLEPEQVVALFSRASKQQPPTTEHTETALVTRLGDRVRDRHARESEFRAYDHFLSWYWEQRTVSIELVDSVGKGGQTIGIHVESLAPLNDPNFRAFFRGRNTVAEYQHNVVMKEVGTNQYATTISRNAAAGRPLQVGDRMEFEFSPFLKDAANGRNNYYGTAILYIVGRGIMPWEPRGERADSFPLPDEALAGGLTTLHVPMSDEPQHRFKQMATNMSPEGVQSFVLGRRLHHTHFGTGRHSEQPNPIYKAQQNKLGPAWAAGSCVACHTNNGRAIPTVRGRQLSGAVVKTAGPNGRPHGMFGSALQSLGQSSEGTISIERYELTTGQFSDGSSFQLRKPVFVFSESAPHRFSVRMSPQLVGLGLLEAIPEDAILSLADPDDADGDGISGRAQIVPDPETAVPRLGRFGYKASQPTVRHQIAGAFNSDMGVTSSVFPQTDGAALPDESPELNEDSLQHLTAYISTLGVPARRNWQAENVRQGSRTFMAIGCAKCHTRSFRTSKWAVRSELRNQEIQAWTDMLLHDMGPGLADNLSEGRASGSEWRTAPLWGIGLTRGVSGDEAWLHDGRARTLEEAILWHGGEAEHAREAFRNLNPEERKQLIAFLRSL